MKIEPTINHDALMAQLDAAYGLNVVALTFIPKGELSLAYVVDCADGSRYFAKLMPNSRQALTMRDNLDIYLAVNAELYQRDLLTSVVAPLPTTDGWLRSEFAGMPLILFPYIAGDTLPFDTDQWPPPVRDQLARDVAALHLATAHLHAPPPSTSAFDLSLIPALERGLAALAEVGSHSRPSHQQLRDLLLPHRATLAGHFAHLRDLYDIVTSKHPQLVLCHTDIHGLNLMVDAQGAAHMLDWENVMLAPAEHDLQAFTGRHFAAFLKVYWQAGGVRQIDIDQLAFYNYHRYLDDLHAYALSILYDNNDPRQDEQDLGFVQTAGLDQLAGAEDELAAIAAAIDTAKAG